MLDDSIIAALSEVRIVLRKKYPSRITRILFIIIIFFIALIPIILFDYWLGRISGLIIVSIFFLKLVWDNSKGIKKS